MMNRLLLAWCFFIPLAINAQTILIKNYQTKKPIGNAHIYNIDESLSVVTDSTGKADISGFKDLDMLVFSHTAFHQIIIRKNELAVTGYRLTLHPSSVDLNEFIISANKRPQSQKEVPQRISFISAKDIAFGMPQTAADMLQQSEQVFIQKSQLGGGSPMIRGFSANRVLIVVDGVRMNNAIFRGGNLQNVISVDPEGIEKTEVVFGPGSVIYGSDALGGVMHFLTKKPKLADSSLLVKGGAGMRFASANQERNGHVDFTISGKKFGSYTSFSISRFKDQLMGSNGPSEYLRNEYVERIGNTDSIIQNSNTEKQVGSGYDQYFITQKFLYKPNKEIDIDYGFYFANTSDIPRYDRLIQYRKGKLRYADWYYGPQKWMMNKLTLGVNRPTLFFDQINATLAYQKFEESRHNRSLNSLEIRRQTENVDVYTFNLDFDNEITSRSSFYYGYEGAFNMINSSALKENILNGNTRQTETRYPNDSQYLTHAVYINSKLNWADKLTINSGVRYSHISLKSTVDKELFPLPEPSLNTNTGAITASLGAAYRPTKTWQINASLASGFRAPNLDDIGKVFESSAADKIVVVPNPELKPENAYSADADLKKSFEHFHVEFGGFYSILKDVMVLGDFTINNQDSILYDGQLSKIQAVQNKEEAKIFGLHANLLADITQNLQLKGAITWMDGKTNDEDPVRHVSPTFASGHVIYSRKSVKVDGYVVYNHCINHEKLAPVEKAKPHLYALNGEGLPYSPAWYTLNLRGEYRLKEFLAVNAAVENITNKRYKPYSSGVTAAGRNFILGLKVFI